MKKTLLTYILATGCAVATDQPSSLILSWDDFSDATSDYSSLANDDGSTKNVEIAVSGSSVINKNDSGELYVAGAANGTANIDLSYADLCLSDGFTISFEVHSISGNGTLFALRGNATEFFFALTVSNNQIDMAYNSSTNNVTTTATANTLNRLIGENTTSGLITVVFSGDKDESNRCYSYFTVYLDGVSIATGSSAYTPSDSSKFNDEIMQTLSFGSWAGNSSNGTMSYETISNVKIYNTALTEAEVLAYAPEPATATLSLLALAGLAARRRRK